MFESSTPLIVMIYHTRMACSTMTMASETAHMNVNMDEVQVVLYIVQLSVKTERKTIAERCTVCRALLKLWVHDKEF